MAHNNESPVRVALIGAGLFTKDAYIPLCSFAPDVRGFSGEDQLDDLLNDDAIDACIVVLPVQVMLQVAVRAIKAGKHVLQEKPVAPSVQLAASAIREYHTNNQETIWAIAENYRSEAAFRQAGQLTQELGTIIKLDLVADMPMNSSNKYFNSQWRRDAAGCPGGFVMDSCVHHIAALRTVGKAAGLGELVEASANAMSLSQDLPPPDTVVGTVKFASSTPASISVTFAGSVLRFSLSVVGTKGSLEVLRGGWQGTAGYQLAYKTEASRESTVEQVPFNGLDEELVAFVDQVNAARNGSKNTGQDISDAAYRTSVEEAARDLAVVEALLESSRQGSRTVSITQVPSRGSS